MRNLNRILLLFVLLITIRSKAQYDFLTTTPEHSRLPALWQHCSQQFISDKDSVSSCSFLNGVAHLADSLNDEQLKKYAIYFRKCFRLLFSANYQQYFTEGDYESPANVFKNAKVWATENGYVDIAIACEHNIGEVYFYAAKYGLAFEHLLKADEEFKKIGYENVPAISIYLYNLGLNYYRFEEYDKALSYFLYASRNPVYLPWTELSTLNSIGLIYARRKDWDKAVSFYQRTIDKAKLYEDEAWVGIASGNLGNVFLTKGQNDSALFYHRKNYFINISARAPEDAAKSALAIATTLIRKQQNDSALQYIILSRRLSDENIRDSAELLEFHRRLLVAMIELNKAKGNYKLALLFSDSLIITKDSLQQMLDAKILNRAVEKTEAERYTAELNLIESKKSLSQLRFYVLITVLLFVMIIAGLLFNRFRVRKIRQAKLSEKEKQLLAVEKIRTEEKLKHAEESLTAYLAIIKEKTELIENSDAELQRLRKINPNEPGFQAIATNKEKLLSSTILTDNDWRHFLDLFEQVQPGFLYRLKDKFPDLSPAEMRLLMLTKLNLRSHETANMLGISLESVRKSRYRLRKKLNLEEESALEDLVQKV